VLYVKGTQDTTAGGSQADSSLSYAAAAAADVADGAPDLALKLRGLSGRGLCICCWGCLPRCRRAWCAPPT